MLVFFCGCSLPFLEIPLSRDKNESPQSSAEPVPVAVEPAGDAGPTDSDSPQPPEPSPIPGNVTEPPEIVGSGESEIGEEEKAAPVRSTQAIIDEALDYCQVSQDFWQKGELENALEALDQAYALLLKVDIYDSPKSIQQKEDLRFMISKRILEIHASRKIVVNGNHKAIPIVLNKHVLAEIKHFTGDEKSFFVESYKRSGRYRHLMVDALKEAGLPTELSWLPLIESGYKANALSSARALGLWQFIASTGYKFGLKRNMYIDERLDPVKATRAATEYLKELHQIFGDWSTALAAYNCGEGRVLRLIKAQNINYLDNFWDLYEQLPAETSRYVPRYLASLHMINNPAEYGLDAMEISEPLRYDTLTITRQAHLKDIGKAIGVSERMLRDLNPELRYRILPNEAYPLRIPPEKSAELLAKLDTVPLSYPPQSAYLKHRVKSGESLSTIAERYRTSVSRIARANSIRKRDYIVTGTILRIPTRSTIIRQTRPSSITDDGKPLTYRVKSGDSLWILAKRYRTTTKKIVALNKLPNTNLHIGQILKIPGRKHDPSSKEGFKTHIVRRGESPFRIAKRYGMSLERFLRINNLSPRSKIYPGQALLVE